MHRVVGTLLVQFIFNTKLTFEENKSDLQAECSQMFKQMWKNDFHVFLGTSKMTRLVRYYYYFLVFNISYIRATSQS